MSLLVIDTSGSRAVVATAPTAGGPATVHLGRPGTSVGADLTLLIGAAVSTLPDGLAGVRAVGVGTGPGSFTGLRVGLAAAKTIAWSLGCPLAGIPGPDALRRALGERLGPDAARCAILRPAGLRDRYLSLPGADPILLPPGSDLVAAVGDHPAAVLDLPAEEWAGLAGLAGADPAGLGRIAEAGLADALLALLAERIAAGRTDDPAVLEPAYVAQPRGVAPGEGRDRWSPELR